MCIYSAPRLTGRTGLLGRRLLGSRLPDLLPEKRELCAWLDGLAWQESANLYFAIDSCISQSIMSSTDLAGALELLDHPAFREDIESCRTGEIDTDTLLERQRSRLRRAAKRQRKASSSSSPPVVVVSEDEAPTSATTEAEPAVPAPREVASPPILFREVGGNDTCHGYTHHLVLAELEVGDDDGLAHLSKRVAPREQRVVHRVGHRGVEEV